jgi:hypothetical protein
LYDRFAPHIFSAVQVRHGKPAPDLFLFAAERMQTAPERCLVIEDSVAGIAGAVAAGMPVLGFHGGSHCREGYGKKLQDAGAAMTFDDMRQLPDLIARIGRKADSIRTAELKSGVAADIRSRILPRVNWPRNPQVIVSGEPARGERRT